MASTLASSRAHEAAEIRARYENVDHAYHEQRENRLMGFLLFLVSDVILFTMFIFAYCYLRNSVPNWPPIVEGGKELPRFDVNFAAVNSVVLFGSGATMHFAMESWKHQNRAGWFRWLIATIVLGIGFLCGQAYEYSSLAISWAGSTMGATFFTLTGMHGFHVFVGVIFLCVLGLQTRAGVYTESKYFGLTAGTLYWHFVDVIWVALFFLFYLW